MKLSRFISKFEKKSLKKQIPKLFVGNNVRIGFIIKEGEKKRVQFFEGIIISKNNSLIDTTITVRRIFQGIGVERTFPINSPQIKSIIVTNTVTSNRAKLFYLRNKIGRVAMKIKSR